MLPVAVLLAACSSDSEDLLPPDTPSGEPGLLQTGFSIVVSNNSSSGATRAPGHLGDGYDTGSGYENYIDITGGNFRFYFFDDRNILIAPMDVEAVLPAGGTATSKTYYVSGHTSENIKNKPLKVVALANWPSYPEPEQLQPGVTTVADICAGQYAFDAANTLPSSTHLIPLFGISLQQTLDFNVMNRAEIGTIHLLRAFAKVEVVKHPDCAVDIEWARIHRYNTRGFCAPQNVNNQDDYVHGSYDKDYVNTPHIPDGCETDSDITMVKTESGSFIAYIPEYRNLINGSPRPDSERTVLHVRFRDDAVRDYGVVEFMDYAGNTGHFDVLRNYWYKFNVTTKDNDPVWIVDVIPFTSVELEPDYGLEREEFTGYVIGKDWAGRDCWFDGNCYDPTTAIPLYLGPVDKPGEFVTINNKEYLLVYTDYERTAAKLDHIFEKETRKKYLLYPAGRTGYENINWTYYLNDLKQAVWLDESNLRVNCCRTMNEWDRFEYNIVAYNWDGYDHDSYNPRYWFDVLGNRYPWSEGDTEAKRKAKLKKEIGEEWIKYLE